MLMPARIGGSAECILCCVQSTTTATTKAGPERPKFRSTGMRTCPEHSTQPAALSCIPCAIGVKTVHGTSLRYVAFLMNLYLLLLWLFFFVTDLLAFAFSQTIANSWRISGDVMDVSASRDRHAQPRRPRTCLYFQNFDRWDVRCPCESIIDCKLAGFRAFMHLE